MVSQIYEFRTDQGLSFVGPNQWPRWSHQVKVSITIPQALELITSLAQQISDDQNAYAPESEACIKFTLDGKLSESETQNG